MISIKIRSTRPYSCAILFCTRSFLELSRLAAEPTAQEVGGSVTRAVTSSRRPSRRRAALIALLPSGEASAPTVRRKRWPRRPHGGSKERATSSSSARRASSAAAGGVARGRGAIGSRRARRSAKPPPPAGSSCMPLEASARSRTRGRRSCRRAPRRRRSSRRGRGSRRRGRARPRECRGAAPRRPCAPRRLRGAARRRRAAARWASSCRVASPPCRSRRARGAAAAAARRVPRPPAATAFSSSPPPRALEALLLALARLQLPPEVPPVRVERAASGARRSGPSAAPPRAPPAGPPRPGTTRRSPRLPDAVVVTERRLGAPELRAELLELAVDLDHVGAVRLEELRLGPLEAVADGRLERRERRLELGVLRADVLHRQVGRHHLSFRAGSGCGAAAWGA